jgi:uncharacterized protein YukE
MNVKVNKSDIEHLTDELDTNRDEIYSIIDDCLNEVENLKNNYQSYEGEYVLETFTEYLEKLKDIPNAYNELNTIIKKASNTYKDNDDAFKRELQKESSETYEPEPEQ